MINDDTIQDKSAKAAEKTQVAADTLFDDPKREIKRRALEAAGDASYAINSIFESIEDSTRRSPGCALLVAGMVGICIGRHFYKKDPKSGLR